MTKVLATSVLLLAGAAVAPAEVNISVNIGSAPYYGYGPEDVGYVEDYVPDYYVPQVFYTARCARVSPSVVVGLYRGGWGWDRIYSHYRVAPYRGDYRYQRGYAQNEYRNGYSNGYSNGYANGGSYGNNYGDSRSYRNGYAQQDRQRSYRNDRSRDQDRGRQSNRGDRGDRGRGQERGHNRD